MSIINRAVKEMSDTRNYIEAYIYYMHGKISTESHLGPYSYDSKNTKFSALLDISKNWLYKDGFDSKKSVYTEKLESLKAVGNPNDLRNQETVGCLNEMAVLQRTFDKY